MSDVYLSPLLQRELAWVAWRDAIAANPQSNMTDLLDLLEERFQLVRLRGRNVAADIEMWVDAWHGDKSDFRKTLLQLAALWP